MPMFFRRVAKDDYPIDPTPRWGYGRPAHRALSAALGAGHRSYSDVLDRMVQFKTQLHAIPRHDPARSGVPYWNNNWFSTLDAASLMYFLLQRKPTHYVEIGSGFSTMFARHAVNIGSLPTTITSIDPSPRANVDRLCDSVVRTPLEVSDLSMFDVLVGGDVLFLDGSHRVFENSDVTVFFLDVLPRLPPGVLIHIHDIFLPHDYPEKWAKRLYSEQYMLAAMLLCERRPFSVVLPNYYIFIENELRSRVEEIFRNDRGGQNISCYYPNSQIPGVSFWIETVTQEV